MKRNFYLSIAAAAVLAAGVAGAAVPSGDGSATEIKEPTAQGIPYLSTLPGQDPNSRQNVLMRDFVMPEEGTEFGGIGDFSLDSIKNWSGEGSKRAGLVIQWNTGRDKVALAFGYRFDGKPTGIDMLRCVVENNPQLYGLFQRTNVSSGNEKFGYTINGIGWDLNCSGVPVSIVDTGNNDEVYTSYTGFFEHPRGCSESVSYPDYDYDNWISADEGDLWQAGWYKGYWSYWLNDGGTAWSYSGVGASGRFLDDGYWDGWNFQPDMTMYEWMPIVAVPSLVPEGYTEVFTVDGITYQLKDAVSAQVIAGNTPYTGDITIPATVTTKDGTFNVTSIGTAAFADAKIGRVVLGESVGTINAKAFCGSTLSSIKFPENLTNMKDSVFAGCANLSALTLPAAMAEIPAGSFAGTGITALDIPASVKMVLAGAFKNCAALAEVRVPNSVQQLSSESFAGCTAITRVTVDATTPITIGEDVFDTAAYTNATLVVPDGFQSAYAAAAGWKNFVNVDTRMLPVEVGDKFLKDGVPYRVTSLDPATVAVTYNHFDGVFRETAVQTANRKLSGDIVVPAEVDYMGTKLAVTEIVPYAFYGANAITSVTLPANLKGVGDHLFDGCQKVTRIVLPEGVDRIPPYLFNCCYALTEIVNLPTRVDTIGHSAFNQCSKLTSIPVFSEGLKVIDRSAFYNTGLASVTIPSTVDSIGYQAFGGTKITSVDIPASVTRLGSQPFYNCRSLVEATLAEGMTELPAEIFRNCSALTTLNMPQGIKKIGDYALFGCSKLNFEIPSTVEVIGKSALYNTAVSSAILPEGLKVIGDQAFYSSKITTLTIPESVDSIGKWAFYNTPITAVTYPAHVKHVGSNLFERCTSLADVTLPDGMTSIPEGTFKGCIKLASLDIPASCTVIGNDAFNGCSALDIEIPSQIVSLGETAFYGCAALTAVTLPEAVTEVPTKLFMNCSALKEVNFAPGTTVIGNGAFNGCKALEVMTLPATLDSIGTGIFESCTSLREVTFPERTKRIPSSMFYSCSALTKVNLPEGLEEIEGSAFRGCSSLESIDIPAGVTKMGTYMFRDCSSLKSFAFPEAITEVPQYMFYNCSALTDVTFAPGAIEIGNYSFYGCKKLESLEIPVTVKKYGSSAFNGCALLKVALHEGLEEIGDYALAATPVTELNFPSTLNKIGGSAFQDCKGLTGIVEFPAHITSLGGGMITGTGVTTAYVHDPLNVTTYDYTFRIVSSWSNPKYCDVVVPYGRSEAAARLTGFKNAASVTEPALDGIGVTPENPAPQDVTAEISAAFDATFSGELSTLFVEACQPGFAEEANVEIIYSLVTTYPDTEEPTMLYAEGDGDVDTPQPEEKTVGAVADPAAIGRFVASLTDLTANSLYTYRWRVTAGGKTIESEPMQFITKPLSTGIEIIMPDASAPVDVYTTTGVHVGTFDRMADVNLTGIYVVLQNGKAFKIAIK